MGKTYKVKWKRRWLWRSRTVTANTYIKDIDKMVLFLPDGSREEIPEWTKCACRQGLDWIAAAKEFMESQAGQSIPIKGV